MPSYWPRSLRPLIGSTDAPQVFFLKGKRLGQNASGARHVSKAVRERGIAPLFTYDATLKGNYMTAEEIIDYVLANADKDLIRAFLIEYLNTIPADEVEKFKQIFEVDE